MLADDMLAGADAAAAYAGLPRRTIYHLAETGGVPAKRIGRKLFFKKSDLDRVFSTTKQAA